MSDRSRPSQDVLLLGADQLLAVQQQERPVGPVRHFQERDGPHRPDSAISTAVTTDARRGPGAGRLGQGAVTLISESFRKFGMLRTAQESRP